jgi:hypothetical protein
MNPEYNQSQSKKIRAIVCDYFYYEGSNNYWREAFDRATDLVAFDVIKEPVQVLWDKILLHKPQHIHMGMSCKGESIPYELLVEARRQFGCSISHFYGDTLFTPYHFRTARIVDRLYFTNQTYPRWGASCGLENIRYILCPTNPEIFKPLDIPKIYDLIFIANNNDPTRIPLLEDLSNKFNLVIVGSNWEGTSLDHKPAAYHEGFAKYVSSAKVNLSFVSPRWKHLDACFSNRLINTLGCGGAVVHTYSQNLESVFQDHKHLLWYKTEAELIEAIEILLDDEALRARLGREGQKEAWAKYTYDQSVARILTEAEPIRQKIEREFALPSKTPTYSLGITQTAYMELHTREICTLSKPEGQFWRDGCSPVLRSCDSLCIESDSIPAQLFDRLDFWRECRRLLLPGKILEIMHPEPNNTVKNELIHFGFSPQPSAGESLSFEKKQIPDTSLDQWYSRVQAGFQPRYGHRIQEFLGFTWCYYHPFSQWIQENMQMKHPLFIWSGLGEWPFAIRLQSAQAVTAIDMSWKAIDTATFTYGDARLRFLPSCIDLFPDQLFDAILFITPPQRLNALPGFYGQWQRITQPSAKVFIGVYPIDAPLPEDIKSPVWLTRIFGEERVQNHGIVGDGYFGYINL